MPTCRTFNRAFWLVALAALGLAAQPVVGQVQYHPTQLGTLGGTDSEAWKINDYGQIVGRSIDADAKPVVFHWQNGEMVALLHEAVWGRNTLPTAKYSAAFGISNTDQVIGTVLTPLPEDASLLCESAIIFRPAPMTDITTPYPGETISVIGAHDSSATDISSDGMYVVGWSSADVARFPLLPAANAFAFLDTPQGGVWADAATGLCGPQNTFLKNLGTLGTRDESSSATAVNNLGQVVGWAYTTYPGDAARGEMRGYAAFLITPQDGNEDGIPDYWGELPDGTADPVNPLMVELGTLGGHNSWARAINDAGLIVGEADTADFHTHAFLWDAGNIVDLGTLGGTASSAAAINEIVTNPDTGVETGGEVVGWSLNAAGQKRAFVVVPQDSNADGKLDQWFVDADADGFNDLMFDLNTLLPSGFKVLLTEARDINRAGQIAGWGTVGSAANAPHMAFVLDPSAANPTDGGTTGGITNQPLADAALSPVEADTTPPDQSTDETGSQSDNSFPPLGIMHFLCGVGIIIALPLSAAGLLCLKIGLRRRVG
jgi:probable HAF family extracellular repeat protein